MPSALTVITGPMFSGKTESLIRLVKRTRDAGLPVQVFVPASDTRNGVGVVRSHAGLDLEALGINAWAVDAEHLDTLSERTRPGTRLVAIDEAQFFPTGLIAQIRKLLLRDIHVVVAGLDRDYREEPFGPMPTLLALADHVSKLTSICVECKQDTARLTYRRTNATQQVLLGAAEAYAPMCRACFNRATSEARSAP